MHIPTTHFYHIPKTGGRSIIAAFMRLVVEDAEELSDVELYQLSFGHPSAPQRSDNFKRFVRPFSSATLGTVFLSQDHLPYHDEACRRMRSSTTPDHSFTAIRDPVSRLFSYFKEYHIQQEQVRDGEIKNCKLSADLGNDFAGSFEEFVRRLSPGRKLEQIWYFSKNLNVDEALSNLSTLTAVIICEDNQAGVEALSAKIGHNLPLKKTVGVRGSSYVLTEEERASAKDELASEYDLYDQLLARNKGEFT